MAKFLHIAVGVVAGALGGALVVLLIAFVVVPGIYDPGPDTVDFATPMVILGAMWLGALLGGAMGAVAGIKVAEGHIRRGAVTFAGTLGVVAVLTLLAAGGLWAMIHMPRSGPNDSAKEKWARGHGPLDPQYGLSLAADRQGRPAREVGVRESPKGQARTRARASRRCVA